MKYQENRNTEDLKEVKRIIIHVGKNKYTITENMIGGIDINKVSDSFIDNIIINPRFSNEISLI